jgi:hypothetical protein
VSGRNNSLEPLLPLAADEGFAIRTPQTEVGFEDLDRSREPDAHVLAHGRCSAIRIAGCQRLE